MKGRIVWIVQTSLRALFLRPTFILLIGILGAFLSMYFSYQLIKVNPRPASLITLLESGCKSTGSEYEIDSQFLSDTVLAIIVQYKTNPYNAKAAVGCRLRAFETVFSGSPNQASIISYENVPNEYKVSTHLGCKWTDVKSDPIESPNHPNYLVAGDASQPAISFCVESDNFKRSHGVLEYIIQISRRNFGLREPDTMLKANYGYRIRGNEWQSLLPTDSNREHFRITYESKTSEKQSWLFILAAIFGASVSAVFEAVLAFGYQIMLKGLAKQQIDHDKT